MILDRIDAFLAADDRARKKKMLPELLADVTREDAIRLAPALRVPSPRVAARITAMLARYGLVEAFEAQLGGLKAGKAELLRSQFLRIGK
jgi:hypothetical protein